MNHSPSLLGISQQWPIMDSICSGLNFRDVISLSRSSRYFSNLPETVTKTQMNINSILKHFVDDPETFRLKMAQNNAIIAGNIALHFFNRFIPLKDGMDLIVSEDDNGIDFIEFICKEEGYRAVETPSDSILPWDWPIDVIEDHNTVRLERGTEVILGVRTSPHL